MVNRSGFMGRVNEKQVRAIAYHEAGHAVACFALGRGVEYVTIMLDEAGVLHGLCALSKADCAICPSGRRESSACLRKGSASSAWQVVLQKRRCRDAGTTLDA